MKLSKVPFKSSKSRGEEEFKSVEILFQSGQLKRTSAGIYSIGPLLLRSFDKATRLAKKILNKYGAIEVSLPELQPKTIWQQSGRWEKYKASDTTFYSKGRDNEYFFSPTAEEFMSDLVRPHINSYKDLNFNVYQIGKKFRDEIRVRGGLTRGKEFIMHDGYSFHDSREAMMAEYENMKKCYYEIFKSFGIDVVAVRAVNGYGGKVSEEIMCFCDIGEDKVLYDEKTGLVLNEEILEYEELKQDIFDQYGEIDFKSLNERRAVEMGHIFNLDQFYSKTMNIQFTNAEGKRDYPYMGTYGFGLSRAVNVALELNCDDDGLCFPLSIAPYQVGIVNLSEEQMLKSQELYDYFNAEGIEVLWDDRDMSLGVKIKDMLLNGIPYIIVLGNKDNGDKLEVENRKTREKKLLAKEELVKQIKEELSKY